MRGTIRRFRRDAAGNFATMFAGTTAALLVGAGIAMDVGRAVSNKEELRDALDAAVLATAKEISFGNVSEEEAPEFLENYLEATLETDIGPGFEYELAEVEIDGKQDRVRAELVHDLPLNLMSFVGVESANFSTRSSALYGFSKVEVAMMFDITGSMWGSKLSNLKIAAKNGIAELLAGNDPYGSDIRVAVVPYAEGVNAGLLNDVVYVETEDTSGDPPPDSDPVSVALSAPDRCSTERKGPGQFGDENPSFGRINRDFRLGNCPASPIVPLTTDEDKLLDAIDDLFAGGTTAGHIGIQWSWYLVSPKWAPYLPTGSAPAAYGDDGTRKFVVIMTDGEFNTAYAGVAKEDSPKDQTDKSIGYARKLCDNMKKSGIEIFTVGFDLSQENARSVLRYCASDDTEELTYYHEASGGDELKQVYENIAHSIRAFQMTR